VNICIASDCLQKFSVRSPGNRNCWIPPTVSLGRDNTCRGRCGVPPDPWFRIAMCTFTQLLWVCLVMAFTGSFSKNCPQGKELQGHILWEAATFNDQSLVGPYFHSSQLRMKPSQLHSHPQLWQGWPLCLPLPLPGILDTEEKKL
jgi:hypothetical protein